MNIILQKQTSFTFLFIFIVKSRGKKILLLCLVLLWIKNDFGPSKFFWSGRNHFVQVHIKVGNLITYLSSYVLDFSGLIFMIWSLDPTRGIMEIPLDPT